MRDFAQIDWDAAVEEDCREIVRLAVREDLERQQDWTTVALVSKDRQGRVDLVVREPGVVAGISAVGTVIDEMQAAIEFAPGVFDGDVVAAGSVLGRLQGNARDLLTCERTMLNLLSRLMGIATLASKYVAEVQETGAHVYDTRKTTPGWRRLEKYAVRCGGARNHRTGLYDAILIKDNHLAQRGGGVTDVAAAVRDARRFVEESGGSDPPANMIVEVEVDTLQQLAAVLSAGPDIVLLDNMSMDDLVAAVAMRDKVAPAIQLDASGGVSLKTIREVAQTGVERISVGALTHSARSLDIGLDWPAS